MLQNKFHVELQRVHKGSPYNCAGYIPEITSECVETVIDEPEVQEMINKTYGRNFILTVHIQNSIDFLVYEITKPKAIL